MLLFLLALPVHTHAQQAPYASDDEKTSDDSQQRGELSAQLQAYSARLRVRALWQRFAPQRRALLSPGSPWLAEGGAPGRVLPVAGEADSVQGWGVWLQGSPSRMRNLSAALRGKGHTLSQTFGLDRQISQRLTVGLNLGYSYSSARTLYNNGRERTHGYSIGPYVSFQVADWLSLDAQGGYVHQRQKMRRSDAAGTHTGKRSSHGFQLSAALSSWKWVSRQAMLSGRLGVIITQDRWRSYTEQSPGYTTAVPGITQRLVQGVAEAGVSVWLDPAMPYARIAYTHDVHRKGFSGSSDRDDFTISGGLLWYGSGEADGLSLDAGGSVIVGRSQQRHWSASLGIKWSW